MIRELCYLVRPLVFVGLLAEPLALLLGEELELAPSRRLAGDWPFWALDIRAILKEPPPAVPLCIRFSPLIEFYLLAMRTLLYVFFFVEVLLYRKKYFRNFYAYTLSLNVYSLTNQLTRFISISDAATN